MATNNIKSWNMQNAVNFFFCIIKSIWFAIYFSKTKIMDQTVHNRSL